VARSKRQPTPGDMIRSLAVILIPVLIIMAIGTRSLGDHPVTVIDYKPVLAKARAEAPYPVLAPVNLPEQWRATRVSWLKVGDPGLNGAPSGRNQWQLGFLAPNDIYVELVQGDLHPDEMVKAQTRDGLPDGESSVNDTRWQRLVTNDDRTRALVSSTSAVTTIVVGDTSYAALESYAATLRTD
jgi:hypothetical protein